MISAELLSKGPDLRPAPVVCLTVTLCDLVAHLPAETPKASTIFLHLSLPSHHHLEYTDQFVYLSLMFDNFLHLNAKTPKHLFSCISLAFT